MPRQQASVEVGGTPQKGETKPRRAFCSPEELTQYPSDGVHTMHDVLNRSLNKFANKPMMGWRDIVRTHDEEKEVTKKQGGEEITEKKTWSYFELSDYKYWTYTEFSEQVKVVSSGLRKLGLDPSTRFNIYSTTSVNWQLMAHSCFAQSISFCTAYDTLGEEGLQHSLSEPEVVGMFTNAELLDTLANVIGNTPTVKYVIYDGKASEENLSKLKSNLGDREGANVISFDDLRQLGKGHPVEATPPKSEDVACIMYTSGSTGAPKGVVLTHGNLVSAIAAVVKLLGNHLSPSDSFLAYLPLAHILEFIVESALTFIGVTMGYGKVKTLTQASVRNCDGDLKAFKPSIMVGVPAVWELIRKGIVGKVNSAGTLKKTLFNGAMSIKKNKIPILSGAMDAIVFKAVKEQTGGRLRLALSGGAPISRETQEFLDVALVTLLQGYGMTESCGMCAIVTPEYMQYGSVGVPVPSIEIKLVDVPDAGYFGTNSPPQGEIYIRGPSVTKGYFKREDLTKEAITADGWLMTGDVGQWNTDGTLSVIDRKKNLVKLQGGEYIAIERLESTYKSCGLISNICVHATTDAKQPMAIIFPHEANLRQALQKNNLVSASDAKDADLSTLLAEKKIQNLVLKETNAVGKRAGLKQLETLQAVVLVSEELPMTAAQKLRRKDIVKKYEDEIKKAYA